jgi:hypothetical protein
MGQGSFMTSQIHSYGKYDVIVEDSANIVLIGPNVQLRISGHNAVMNACVLAKSLNSFQRAENDHKAKHRSDFKWKF